MYSNKTSRDKPTSVRIPEEICKTALAIYAKEVGRTKGTVSNLINDRLKEYVERHNGVAPPGSVQISFDDLRRV